MKNELSAIKKILDQITDPKSRDNIKSGPYTGLLLQPTLSAMRNSSWDFPSAMLALCPTKLAKELNLDNMPMHPGETEDILRLFQEYDPTFRQLDFEFDT